jgi:hypothetical protein
LVKIENKNVRGNFMKAFLPQIFIATFASLSCSSLFIAQPSIANPNQPFGTEADSSTNPLSTNGSDFSLFNLIHQAKFGTIEINSEEQKQQLDDVAARYRARQQQQQSVTETPGVQSKPLPMIFPLNQDK